MENYTGITVSDIVPIRAERTDRMMDLLHQTTLNGSVEWDYEDCLLSVSGESWFDVYPDVEGAAVACDPITGEFLAELSDIIVEDATFDIQTLGFDGTEFPVDARRYIVRDGRAVTTSLRENLRPVKAQTNQLR